MEKDSKKLAELLKQLDDSGYKVTESNIDSGIKNLETNSKLSEDTLKKLSGNEKAEFSAWVAWNKSF